MTRSRRVSVRIFATVALSTPALLLVANSAAAQTTTTVTFNAQTESSPGSGTRFLTNCYTESGYVFTAVGLPCSGPSAADAFVAGSANSPLFGGGPTPSLLLNSPMASEIDLTRMDGAYFRFASIGLAPFDGAMTTVLFTGQTLTGPVTNTVTLSGMQMGFQTFTFGSAFTGVRSVRISATNEFGEPLVKFDDVVAVSQAAVVPEPSSILLMFAGLSTLAVVTSRRGRRS